MPAIRPITLRAAAVAALASVMTISLLPAATLGYNPPPPDTRQAEKNVLRMINQYRGNHGLAPLRMDRRVRFVARDRSRDMRNNNYFAHGSPSGQSAGTMMHSRSISHWGWGENIGRISFLGWGTTNKGMLDGWKGSSGHNRMLLTRDYNYVGVGIARNEDVAYYTIVFVKQPDHTPPRAGILADSRSVAYAAGANGKRSVTIRWWGMDRRLQQYTAGLKGFVVQKRTSSGWQTVRNLTTSRQMTVSLARGTHKYRVKAVDRRGNRGIWHSYKITVH